MKIAFCRWQHPNWIAFFKYYWTVDLYNGETIPNGTYDVIFMYHLGNLPPFVTYAKEVRKKYPTTPIIMMFDWELPLQQEKYSSILFEIADLIIYVSLMSELQWNKKHSDKYMFSAIPRKDELFNRTAKPDKTKWVAVMCHTVGHTIDYVYNVKDLNMKMFRGVWIKEKMPRENFMCFPYLSWNKYMDELSTCYVGYDSSDYNGYSRFVLECAMYKIPVVSNKKIMSNSIANPTLCLDSLTEQRKQIDLLLSNPTLRNQLGENAYTVMRKQHSYSYIKEKLENRFKELITSKRGE